MLLLLLMALMIEYLQIVICQGLTPYSDIVNREIWKLSNVLDCDVIRKVEK
jgi:hypothetical protein